MALPTISASEVITIARRLFSSANIAHETISSAHGSWRVGIGGREDLRWLEVVWGPLSGFGATDVKNLPADDPDIFAPYEVAFSSLVEAERWLEEKAKAEANQAPDPTRLTRPETGRTSSI